MWMTAVSDRQRRPEVVSRHLLLFSSHRLPVQVDRFRAPRAASPAGPAERTSFAVTRTERSWNCQGERPFLIQEFICVLKNFGQVQVSNLLPPDECAKGEEKRVSRSRSPYGSHWPPVGERGAYSGHYSKA